MTKQGKRVGKMRPPLENIEELFIQHATAMELWEASNRVALRLQDSNFDSVKHWWELVKVPHSNASEKVWNSLSLFLESCSDKNFEKFFNKIQSTDIGNFLEILHDNNSSGEEIFAFLFNISPFIRGRQSQKINNATKNIEKALRSSPNINLVKVGNFYNFTNSSKKNGFKNFLYWDNFLKRY